jgi:hypothetical protein
MPPVSPKKKKPKVSSAIHTTLEQSPKGLLKFSKKCKPAEYKGQVQLATEEKNKKWKWKKQRAQIDKICRNEKSTGYVSSDTGRKK